MKTRLPIAVALAICVNIGAGPMSAQPPAESPLEKLSWLVGGKWVAYIKSPKGDPLTVETRFEWAGHKKALKYTIVFKTKDATVTQYEGMYWWNPAKKGINLLQIDKAGNVTEALMTIDGDKFTQRNTLIQLDGRKSEQRAEFIRENADSFSFKGFVPKKGDDWVEAVGFKYKRVHEGAGPKPK